MDVPDWSTAVASMIGLGVGIDYALLILTRHRAALATGSSRATAVVEAVSTAGHSVLIAGTTVVISLLGLFLMGLSYLQGVALSASFAVLVTMAASVTLLPALLGFAGRKVDRLRIPGTARGAAADPDATPAARWSRGVQRRPWTAALAAAARAARARHAVPRPAPRLPRRRQRPRGDDHPPGLRPRVAGLRRRRQRPAAARGRAARARRPRRARPRWRAALREEPGIAAVGEPAVNAAGDTAVLMATPTTSPQSTATGDLIRHLRADVLPSAGLPVSVGGDHRVVRRPGRRHRRTACRCSSAAS